MPHIYIDADGCPVKDEVYKVAQRYKLNVTVVANKWMRVPECDEIRMEVVGDGFDEADDWIVDNCTTNDIVIAIDIPLADRCLKKDARVLGYKGRVFTVEGIGDALANREIAANLRDAGVMTGGPAPFGKKDRARFLQALDALVHAARKGQ
ncbi:MAG: YaiI/YqxD family protein [Candidatus Hydrogenedentes bacterium]|nr:YaiI/YqxD family protein [Candidatus Hydrogenedentota bacterium]